MRIVYLHQYFATPSQAGGTRSYEMARRWVAMGHEVHLLTARGSDSSQGWQRSDIDGIQLHSVGVPYDNEMSYVRRIVSFVMFAALTARKARQLRGDVVFATSTPLTIFLPARFATLFRRTPIVFEVRDLWPEMPIAMGALRHPALRWLALRLERWAYRKSRMIVALSTDMARGIEAAGIDPSVITVAENSCDLDLFDVPRSLGESYRARNPWLGDRQLVAYCGTVGRVNGVAYLVDIAAEFRRRGHDAVFAVYGSGAERQQVLSRAAEAGVLGHNFFVREPVSKSDMPEILSAVTVACSLFLPIPQMEANSANKFFDALAAGKPVVLNYGGWQESLLRDHQAGLSLPPQSAEPAADQLEALLALPVDELHAYGARARRLGMNQFSRDVIAERVLNVLLDAVASS